MGNIALHPLRSRASGRASLPALVALVLAVALVLRIGWPLWVAFEPKPASGPVTAAAETGRVSAAPDLAALQSLRLFDAPAAAAATEPAPALNTSLNLKLEGLILAGNPDESLAVIVSGAQRGSYHAGDSLPGGANIRVDSIARDHVVIDNRGQREALWLYTGANRAAQAPAAAVAANPQLALPPGVDDRMIRTAARLAEIISVMPEYSNGNLIGYRLAPGMRLKDFVNLGFEEGDIVTAANGIALNDVANLPKLYSLMDGASEVSFSLLRKGAPLERKVTLMPENSNRTTSR